MRITNKPRNSSSASELLKPSCRVRVTDKRGECSMLCRKMTTDCHEAALWRVNRREEGRKGGGRSAEAIKKRQCHASSNMHHYHIRMLMTLSGWHGLGLH